jgi:hypothetical protein
MSDFLDAVTNAFSTLIDSGQLRVEASSYDAQAFGNAMVILASNEFRIRVVRDRDDVFADAASRLEPEEWYPLERAIRAAGVPSAPPESLLSPAQAAGLVERYYSVLARGFAAEEFDRTKRQLALLEQQAHERTLERLKGRRATREAG